MDKKELMEDFKSYLVDYYNDAVYDEMKSFLSQVDIDDKEYNEILNYFVREMNGSIVWEDN